MVVKFKLQKPCTMSWWCARHGVCVLPREAPRALHLSMHYSPTASSPHSPSSSHYVSPPHKHCVSSCYTLFPSFFPFLSMRRPSCDPADALPPLYRSVCAAHEGQTSLFSQCSVCVCVYVSVGTDFIFFLLSLSIRIEFVVHIFINTLVLMDFQSRNSFSRSFSTIICLKRRIFHFSGRLHRETPRNGRRLHTDKNDGWKYLQHSRWITW